MSGYKNDAGKARLSLIPVEALHSMARALALGEKKYPPYNWRGGMLWSRVYDALLRHLGAFWSGEECDSESGLSHLDHAFACLAFLQSYSVTGAGEDDRYKPRAETPAPDFSNPVVKAMLDDPPQAPSDCPNFQLCGHMTPNGKRMFCTEHKLPKD